MYGDSTRPFCVSQPGREAVYGIVVDLDDLIARAKLKLGRPLTSHELVLLLGEICVLFRYQAIQTGQVL